MRFRLPALSLVLALAVLVSACSSGKVGLVPATVTPTGVPTAVVATPTPFPTLTPTPAFVIPTPVSTIIPSPTATVPADLPPASPDVVLIPLDDPLLGFGISYPEDWNAGQGDVAAGEPAFFAQASLGLPLVYIEITYASQPGMQVAAAAQEQLAEVAATLGADSEVIKEGPTTLEGGTPAYFFDITSTSSGLPVTSHVVIVTRGAKVFRIIEQTIRGDFASRMPVFERIAASLRTTEPVAFGLTKQNALTMALPGPSTLDPHTLGDAASYNYVVQIFSGLVGLDRDLKVVPELAERWDILDGGTTYVFHLRAGAKFHSGKAVTAQDVKYSFERATSTALESHTARLYLTDIIGVTEKLARIVNQVSGVTVVDDHTVRIKIKEPISHFLYKLTYPVAYVVEKSNVERGVIWFVSPDGTGPFKLRGWEPGFAVTLERNTNYYKTPAKTPYILIWNFGSKLLNAFLADDVDITPIGLGEIARGRSLPTQFKETSALNLTYIGFNTKQAPFDDVRARRALMMSTDVATIITNELSGAVEQAPGILPKGMPGYDDSRKPVSYNPAAAKLLWDQVLKDEGISVENVRIFLGGAAPTDVLVVMAEQWRLNLGITLQVASSAQSTAAHLYDFGWVADYPDPQNFLDLLFHSDSVNNYGLYSSTQFDALIALARVEQDTTKRLDLYRQAEDVLLDDGAALPLWYGRNYYMVKPSVRNWALSLQNVPDLAAIELTRTLSPVPTPTPIPRSA